MMSCHRQVIDDVQSHFGECKASVNSVRAKWDSLVKREFPLTLVVRNRRVSIVRRDTWELVCYVLVTTRTQKDSTKIDVHKIRDDTTFQTGREAGR